MNKADVIRLVSEKTNKPQVDVTPVVNGLIDVLREQLYQEEDISLAGLGKFGIKKREARTARNPQTGEPVEVPAKNAVFFRPSKDLKEYVQDE